MRSSTNREDPNEMPPTAAFHQSLHFLLKQKDLQTKIMKQVIEKLSFIIDFFYHI